eukprot:6484520-Amphidinium_carterae.2
MNSIATVSANLVSRQDRQCLGLCSPTEPNVPWESPGVRAVLRSCSCKEHDLAILVPASP